MLKVTLHSSKPHLANLCNLLGRLDVGYAKLAAVADYKVSLFACGTGEVEPVRITGYPRWSASIWDLVTRAICLSLNRKEEIWPRDMGLNRKGAYIQEMSAIVEHWPDGRSEGRATIGTAVVQMQRRRCTYVATFEDDLTGQVVSELFCHTPPVLTPWDLLTRAYARAVTGGPALPKRPTLCVPLPVEFEGKSYVLLDTLQDPAATGVRRWMLRQGIESVSVPMFEGECITEEQFVRFLEKAV